MKQEFSYISFASWNGDMVNLFFRRVKTQQDQ